MFLPLLLTRIETICDWLLFEQALNAWNSWVHSPHSKARSQTLVKYPRLGIGVEGFLVLDLVACLTLRRTTGCGVFTRINCAVSATEPGTSARTVDFRLTISVEPALTLLPGGMLFVRRRSASVIPTFLAAAAGRIVVGTTQAVQLAS